MFDKIIYKILDKIVNWCERYKEYKIKKSNQNLRYDNVAREAEVKKVGKSASEKSYK